MIYGEDVRSISTLWHTGSQCICLKTWRRRKKNRNMQIHLAKEVARMSLFSTERGSLGEKREGRGGEKEWQSRNLMALYFPGEASIIEFYDPVMGANQPPPQLVCLSANWFSLGVFLLFFSSALNIVNCTRHWLSITTYWNIMRLESLPLHRSKWVCF